MLLSWNGKGAARRVGAAVVLGLGLAGCKDASVPAPETGRDYYPVAVGNYWIYAVADTSWSQATPAVPSVATPSAYQFRETIAEEFTDAAGQKAYRLVRAKRVPPSTAWRDDSVFVLSATAQTVVLNRNNTRTVELIFPVREGRLWNLNAYNNNFNDTITAETRRYRNVSQPFGAGTGAGAQTYPATVTTTNEGEAKADDLYYVKTYQQVYGKAVGPVYRRTRRFANFFVNNTDGTVSFVSRSYLYGFSRTETLVEYGPR